MDRTARIPGLSRRGTLRGATLAAALAALSAATSRGARAQASTAPADATLARLRALNARFIHNFVTNDVASHDAMLHPGFINIRPNGQRQSRADYLRAWATGFDPDIITYWDTRDERIDVFGDVALVRATNRHIIRRAGAEVDGMTTYTDTYLREGGAWLCIQAQLTPYTATPQPGVETIVSVYLRGQLQPRPG
jgi:ketosteroid isomerase-like protein